MKPPLLFLGLVVAAVTSSAADRTPLIGVWKLLSYQTEFQDGTPKRATFGEHPSGYIIFTGEGRMMAVLEAEARKAPSSDAEGAALLRSMFAYTGKYRMDGNRWITTVDVAWNPAWHGTEQVRSFELVGDKLTVTSMWQPSVVVSGSPVARGILVFERVKYMLHSCPTENAATEKLRSVRFGVRLCFTPSYEGVAARTARPDAEYPDWRRRLA